MEYEIKVTGSSTIEQLINALRYLAGNIELSLYNGCEVEGTYEDFTLCTEITSI